MIVDESSFSSIRRSTHYPYIPLHTIEWHSHRLRTEPTTILCAICTSHVDLKGSLDRHNLTLCVPPLHIQSISIVCHLCVQVQAQGCPVVCMGTSIRSFRHNGAVIASTSPTTRSTQWSIEQHQNVMC